MKSLATEVPAISRDTPRAVKTAGAKEERKLDRFGRFAIWLNRVVPSSRCRGPPREGEARRWTLEAAPSSMPVVEVFLGRLQGPWDLFLSIWGASGRLKRSPAGEDRQRLRSGQAEASELPGHMLMKSRARAGQRAEIGLSVIPGSAGGMNEKPMGQAESHRGGQVEGPTSPVQ